MLPTGVQLRHCHPALSTVHSHENLNNPLIPDLAIIRLAPHADFNLRFVGDVYWGLLILVSHVKLVKDVQHGSLTFSGKKMGNQLIMSRLLWSIVTGLVLSSTFSPLLAA